MGVGTRRGGYEGVFACAHKELPCKCWSGRGTIKKKNMVKQQKRMLTTEGHRRVLSVQQLQ